MGNSSVHLAGQGPAPRPSARGPIDLEHLSRQALGDPGLAEEVLLLYSQMSQVYLRRIEASTSVTALMEHLHTLKSAAAGIGAWAVRDLIKLAEDDLRAGASVNPERIGDIALAVEECSNFIAGYVVPDPS